MNIITGRLGPREIALGIAFGVLLGLMPKENLLFAGIAVLFLFSHSNIVIGILTATVTAFAAPWVAPLANLIGREILTSSAGQRAIGAVFQVPLLPWTMLDNTLVLGLFLLGMTLFLPLFMIVWIPLKILMPKKQGKKENVSAGA